MANKKKVEEVARGLGASRVVPLPPQDHSPFGMLALTQRVRELRSTGHSGSGRPADAAATVPRLVKFRPGTWRRLGRIAKLEAALTGRRVSPAQIAAMLLEESVPEAEASLRVQSRVSMEKVLKTMKAAPIPAGAPRYSRDELHERR